MSTPDISAGLSFALYARTSTQDLQSPEDSLAWQRNAAEALIGDRGTIVAVYHDIGHSRSLPWSRRPVASRLMGDVRSHKREWDQIVVAESARAFSGGEYGIVLPSLTKHEVTMWLPEVGGRIDPNSDAQDVQMAIYGSMAKAERAKTRSRVISANYEQASRGIFLGGRPPYGYELVDDGDHPNRHKASMGMRRRRIAARSDTAPIVVRIFEMHVSGMGFRAIALQLTNEGIPSPSASDPSRNQHRSQYAWAGSAVPAILGNATYVGRREYGRIQKADVLYDEFQPQLGYTTARIPNRDPAVESDCEPLISQELWNRSQHVRTERAPGTSRPLQKNSIRATPGKYLLAGRIRCVLCGRKMEGQSRSRVKTGEHVLYVCRLSHSSDYARPPAEHPKTLAVAEQSIVDAIDRWIAESLIGDIDATIATLLAADSEVAQEPVEVVKARRDHADITKRIDRLLRSVETGAVEPDEVGPRLRTLRAERAAAEQLSGAVTPTGSTFDEMTLRTALAGLAATIAAAKPEDRTLLYSSLGITVEYSRDAGQGVIQIGLDNPLRYERVEGATPPPTQRILSELIPV